MSFDRMTAAAETFGRLSARQTLRVSAPTTFALRWLIPRLDRFHALRPDVDVAVWTTTTFHQELRSGFDVAIRRGAPQQIAWPQHETIPFLPEADTLIVSPGLLEREPLHRPVDIRSHVLIGSETRPGDWADWLERAGLQPKSDQRRRLFDHFFVSLQAVIDGLGLGIGPLPVLQSDLAIGRILTPFPDIRVSRPGYAALVPFDARKTLGLRNFIDWLIGEATDSASNQEN